MIVTARSFSKWIAVAAAVAALLPAARAQAYSGGGLERETAAAAGLLALVLVLPGDVGVAVPTADPSAARLVIGWSFQIPLEHELRHRLVPSLDLIPQSGPAVAGRLGYRYARRHAFAGAGVGLDAAGVNLSPEIGVKFAHAERDRDSIDLSLHLLVRAAIAPDSGRVRGATVLLGWNLL
jgi:hypothetical protein